MTIQNTDRTQAVDLILSFGEPRKGNETVGGEVKFVSGGKVLDEYEAKIPRRSAIQVTVDVRKFSTFGTVEVPVLNHGERIGGITVLRYPFGVTPENPATAIPVSGDAPTTLTLVNADPVPYTIKAELTVAGQRLCAKPLSERRVRSCLRERLTTVFGKTLDCPNPAVTVPASQKATVDFYPQCEISSGLFTGLLKDEQRPARLSLIHDDANAERRPDVTFPLTANVGYGFLSEFWRQIWSTVFIALVLALGGIASVLSRYWVPNEVSRHRLLERLDRFDLRASDLSENVGSELRVAVRVNAKRLMDLLKSLPPISADTSAFLADYEKRFQTLELKFDRLDQLDTAWQRLRQIVPEGPAPSAVRAIERRLRKAAQLLESPDVSAVDLENARTTVDEALQAIETLPTPDDAFKQEARTHLTELKQSFETECGLKNGTKVQELRTLLPGAFCLLTSQQPVDAWLDSNLAALDLLRDYLRLFSVSTDATVVQRLVAHEGDLVRLLSSPTASGLRDAALLLRQMREGVFESDILEAIRQRQFSIECDPKTFGPYQLVTLHVRLHRPDFNGASARQRVTCVWHFPDLDSENAASEAQSTERGWEIRHYFVGGRTAAKSRVEVSFIDASGTPVAVSSGEPLREGMALATLPDRSHRSGGRMRAEWVGLVVVLFIALLGLITGAREQITKLDMVPGLIAVFLLGFGADSIKSLLAQRPGTPAATS